MQRDRSVLAVALGCEPGQVPLEMVFQWREERAAQRRAERLERSAAGAARRLEKYGRPQAGAEQLRMEL